MEVGGWLILPRQDDWNTRKYFKIDFSLTVKAATLIFISGIGSAISSAKQGKSGSIHNLVKNKLVVWATKTCMHHENPNRKHTELTFINPLLKAHNHKMYAFVVN